MKLDKVLVGTLAIVLVAGLVTPAFADGTLYAVSSQDDQLRTIDPTDGLTLDSVTISLAGEVVQGATGLATSPSGVLTAVLKLEGISTRELVTLDPITGVATSIGNLGDKFAAIAYHASSGQLLGITGNQGTPAHGVHIISTNDASTVFLCQVSQGAGEMMAFNPNDLLFYRGTGFSFNTNGVFQSIDDTTVDPCGVTDFGPTGAFPSGSEANSLTFWNSQNTFLLGLGFGVSELWEITPSGVGTFVGNFDFFMPKGLAFVDDVVGGEFLPIDSTALLMAAASSPAAWLTTLTIAALGFGAYVFTRNPNNMRNIKVILRDYLDRF